MKSVVLSSRTYITKAGKKEYDKSFIHTQMQMYPSRLFVLSPFIETGVTKIIKNCNRGLCAKPGDAVGAFVEEEVHDGEAGDEAAAGGEELVVGAIKAEVVEDGVRLFRVDAFAPVVIGLKGGRCFGGRWRKIGRGDKFGGDSTSA